MRISAVALALLLPACIVGTGEIDGVGDDQGGTGGGGGDGDGTGNGGGNGGGSGGGGMTSAPRVTASIDKQTVATELGKTETLAVTINSTNGFSGPVTITPAMMDGTTAMTGWTITADPQTVELAADASATVNLSVKVPTDPTALTPTLKLDLGNSAAPVSVESAFNVTNQITITIPAGTGTGSPHAGLPAANAPIRLRMGAKVVFHNADTAVHRIHANGGIDHQPNDLAPGADYIATPDDSATWYCHTHEGAANINRPILVQ